MTCLSRDDATELCAALDYWIRKENSSEDDEPVEPATPLDKSEFTAEETQRYEAMRKRIEDIKEGRVTGEKRKGRYIGG